MPATRLPSARALFSIFTLGGVLLIGVTGLLLDAGRIGEPNGPLARLIVSAGAVALLAGIIGLVLDGFVRTVRRLLK